MGKNFFDGVLDVMLPKRDGWTVLTTVRKISPEIKILLLTAKSAIEDRVKGLELGADDYLVKPFAFSELLARIKAILRRNNIQKTSTLSIADLEVDLSKHKVKRGNLNIDLTAKEFTLLVFLLQHQGEAVSRTLITEQVWDIHFDTDTNVIDVSIRRLRQKIDDPFEKKLLHTIRGIGYVLEER